MLLIIKSLFTGFICGIIFSLLKLPIPAPTVLAGVMGIIGIWLGFALVSFFK